MPELPNFDLVEIIAKQGLRNTRPRRTIWQVAYEMQGHFNAEDLLIAVNKIDAEVSRATIYRSLPELVRSKILREVDVGHNDKHYVSTKNSKDFFGQVLCDNCTQIIEFKAPFLEGRGDLFTAQTKFQFISQHYQIVVHCPYKNCKYHSPKKSNQEPGPNAPCMNPLFIVHHADKK